MPVFLKPILATMLACVVMTGESARLRGPGEDNSTAVPTPNTYNFKNTGL